MSVKCKAEFDARLITLKREFFQQGPANKISQILPCMLSELQLNPQSLAHPSPNLFDYLSKDIIKSTGYCV